MKGWRPISVTYQPATVASQPEKVIAASSRSIGAAARLRHPAATAKSHRPDQLGQQHRHPDADHRAKGEEQRRDRRMRIAGIRSGPGSRRRGRGVRIRLAELGHADRQVVARSVSVGHREQQQGRALSVFQIAFHGGDLLRLVLERVEAVRVADDDLQRRSANAASVRPTRITLRCRALADAAQHLPCRRPASRKATRQRRGQQHVRQA